MLCATAVAHRCEKEKVIKDVTSDLTDTEIEKFEFSHFKLVNYTHDKRIKMDTKNKY